MSYFYSSVETSYRDIDLDLYIIFMNVSVPYYHIAVVGNLILSISIGGSHGYFAMQLFQMVYTQRLSGLKDLDRIVWYSPATIHYILL